MRATCAPLCDLSVRPLSVCRQCDNNFFLSLTCSKPLPTSVTPRTATPRRTRTQQSTPCRQRPRRQCVGLGILYFCRAPERLLLNLGHGTSDNMFKYLKMALLLVVLVTAGTLACNVGGDCESGWSLSADNLSLYHVR